MFCTNCNGLLRAGTNACARCTSQSPQEAGKSLEERANAPHSKPRASGIRAAAMYWEKICPTKEVAKEHYIANFPGRPAHKLKCEDASTRSFWNYMRRRNWLDICESSYRDWKCMAEEELLAYREKHFSGLSDRKVRTLDPGFASALKRRGPCESLKK